MSVLKPDSVISCVGENDVYVYPYRIDTVYDGDKSVFNPLSSTNDGGWRPIIPDDGDWKTWLIYKFNKPKNISKIIFTVSSLDYSNAVWVAKNVDTSYTPETIQITFRRTSYNTLNIVNNNTLNVSNTLKAGITGMNSVISIDITGNEDIQLNNVTNLLFIFNKPVIIFEIECIGEDIPLPKLKTEKGDLKLIKFIPENYCMFSPSIDSGNAPKWVNSIMLLGNDIYFCLYEGSIVKIIRFNKDGQSLDNIYIENLNDKSKLKETLLKPPTETTVKLLQSNLPTSYYLYNYPNINETKTKTEWEFLLRQYRVTPDMVKRLYENGDEKIVLSKDATTSVEIDTELYVNALQTDRIFIYDTTNKLVHITDYLPKGNINSLTLIKNNNIITSKIVQNIMSGYGSVGNIPYTNCNDTVKTGCTPFIKGYSWDKIKIKRLSGETNNVCVAITNTSIDQQSQNVLAYGKVTDDNKCKLWKRSSSDEADVTYQTDFRYLNELNDSGLQWVNKNQATVSQRKVKYIPDTYFGRGLPNFAPVCRLYNGEIGSVVVTPGSNPKCRIAEIRSLSYVEDDDYDVLYSTDDVPTRVYNPPQNCPLDCNSTDIKNKITNVYNNSVSYKGKYTMSEIINTNKVSDNTCDIHYKFSPVLGFSGQPGEDYRRFKFTNDNCNYKVSLMDKGLSGTTLREINFPNKISLKTKDGKFCTDTDNGIVCDSSTDGINETFQVEKISKDKIALKGKRNLYCSDYGYGVDATTVDCFSPYKDSWETFNYENLGNNQVSIKSGKTNNYCAYKTDSKLVCDQPTSSRTDQSKFTYTAK